MIKALIKGFACMSVLTISFVASAQEGIFNKSQLSLELRTFVRQYHMVSFTPFDLDADGDLDALLVLERAADKTNATGFTQRRLLILERDAKGVLKKAAENKHIIQCARCGGSKDPFSSDDAFKFGHKWFSVYQESFAGNQHNSTYTFRKLKDGLWYLVRFENNRTVSTDAGVDLVSHIKNYPKDFSKIRFERFNPDVFAKRYHLN